MKHRRRKPTSVHSPKAKDHKEPETPKESSKKIKNTNPVMESLQGIGGDLLGSAIVAPFAGALSGRGGLFLGAALNVLGHHLKGKWSSLLRVTGASMIGFGVASGKAYRDDPNLQTAADRLAAIKDDWYAAAFLQAKAKEDNPETEQEQVEEPLGMPAPTNEVPQVPSSEPQENLSEEIEEPTADITKEELERFWSNYRSKSTEAEDEEELEGLEDEDLDIDGEDDLSLI